jgi:glycosyltransferase involved in cell wall biosynthesis
MDGPLVSILSPAYNHEGYIQQCIESALHQSYPNWEMIIVDDGSTDDTLKIAKKYSESDPRIRVYSQKNVGPFHLADTYNFALKESHGKYIAILECDDYWEKEKLEKQIKSLESSPDTVLSWGRAAMVTTQSETIRIIPIISAQIDHQQFSNDPPGRILSILYLENIIPALTLLIRKESLQEIGGFSSGIKLPLVDYPTLLRLSLKGSFSFCNEVLGYWRIYANQVTKTHTVAIYEGMYETALEHCEENKAHPEIQKIDLKSIHHKWMNSLLIAYSRSGRYKLIRKDFKGARQDYSIACSCQILLN